MTDKVSEVGILIFWMYTGRNERERRIE